MNLPERLEKAITKLYTAFHEEKLNPHKNCACAVGQLVGHGNWLFGSFRSLSIGEENKGHFNGPNPSGYSLIELRQVEKVFLMEWIKTGSRAQNKETQFKGLCAVIEYLCELDGIPNVMDYQKLFEYTDENKPKYELSNPTS